MAERSSVRLEGSCHCGSVRFTVHAPSQHPYLLCYCSICRKTAGGGGYAINLGAAAETLNVEGSENVSEYQAHKDDGSGTAVNPARWSFCHLCGSSLWVYSTRWPELVHPFASAIDTPLPEPPEKVRMMLNYAAPWVEIPAVQNERHFPELPDESLEEWHRRHGVLDR